MQSLLSPFVGNYEQLVRCFVQRFPFVFSVLLMAGCACAPDDLVAPAPTGEPWDTTYLISADPGAVTSEDLAAHATKLTEHYWKYNQVEGVVWPGWRSDSALEFPDRYGTGGDGSIFTGLALATYALEYGVVGGDDARDRAIKTLRGLYWLTHAAGRGVIARCVFPIADGDKWGYPGSRWEKYPDFMKKSAALTTPWEKTLPEGFYYTRATKDQLTGILFGLSTAWVALKDVMGAKELIATIVEDLRAHLVKHDWKIRNEDGENNTSSDSVTRLLRVTFNALYRHTATISNPAGAVEAEMEYVANFRVRSIENAVNISNNYSQYYAHNLRMMRGFSIWLLEIDPERRKECKEFIVKDVWRYTKNHQNAWYAALTAAVDPENDAARAVMRAGLRSVSLKPLRGWGSPYAGQDHSPGLDDVLRGCDEKWVVAPHLRKPSNYFTWQKRPWDVGSGQSEEGRLEQTGLDFLAPYWLGKALGGL